MRIASCHDIGLSRHGAYWTIEEEHQIDRLYRLEQKQVQNVACIVGRTPEAVMGRLALLYFGKSGGTGDTRRPWSDGRRPWSDEEDAQLKELYDGLKDRVAIVEGLRRESYVLTARLLKLIPRPELCLTKAGIIGQALRRQRPLSFHHASRCSNEAALMTLSIPSTPFVKCRRLFNNTVPQSQCTGSGKVRVVACSLDFVWEDELRGLAQLVLARRQHSPPHPTRPVPCEAARLILKFLTLPRYLSSPRVNR